MTSTAIVPAVEVPPRLSWNLVPAVVVALAAFLMFGLQRESLAYPVLAAGIGLLAGRATRGVKDSDEIATDRQGAKEYFGVSGRQDQGTQGGTGVATGAVYDQGYDRNLTATETSGYTPADPYAYRSDEQGEAARTYTDRVPGTVYPDQEGDRR